MTANTPPRKTTSFGLATFVAIQIVIVGIAVGGVTFRSLGRPSPYTLPELQDNPLEIRARNFSERVVSDEELSRVLDKLVPRDWGSDTKINHIDHGLRFWGMGATFGKKRKALSSEEMRTILLNQTKFQSQYRDTKPLPLLIDEGEGVRFRTQKGFQTSSHFDHTMACLAEVGTPLSFPVVTENRETTFRAVVEHAMRSFSLNQVEYEWSALTFALYLPPQQGWTTHEGQYVDFDMLATRIMRQRPKQGVCFGNHRVFTLAVMLRVDEGERGPILTPSMRNKTEGHLRNMTDQLLIHQHDKGYWDGDWAYLPAKDITKDEQAVLRTDRILATGHALEWWAIAPTELTPIGDKNREPIVRAAKWLVREIDSLSDEEVGKYYTYLSHAGRALALWRNTTPAETQHPKVTRTQE